MVGTGLKTRRRRGGQPADFPGPSGVEILA